MYLFVKYLVDVSVSVQGCVRACNPLKGGLHAHNTQPGCTHVQNICTLKIRVRRGLSALMCSHVQQCALESTGRKRGVHMAAHEIWL